MSKDWVARATELHTFLKRPIHGIMLEHCRLQRLPLGRPQQLLVGSRLQLVAIEEPVGYGQQAGMTAVVLAQNACTSDCVAARLLVSSDTDTSCLSGNCQDITACISIACALLRGMPSDRYRYFMEALTFLESL